LASAAAATVGVVFVLLALVVAPVGAAVAVVAAVEEAVVSTFVVLDSVVDNGAVVGDVTADGTPVVDEAAFFATDGCRRITTMSILAAADAYFLMNLSLHNIGVEKMWYVITWLISPKACFNISARDDNTKLIIISKVCYEMQTIDHCQ
jgi:hypothetical protein